MFPKRFGRPLAALAGVSLLIALGACAQKPEPMEPATSDVVVPQYDAAGLMPSVQTRTTLSGEARVDLGVSAVLVAGDTAYVRLAVDGLGEDAVSWSDFLPTRTSTMAQGPGLPLRLLDLRRSQVHDSTTLDRPDANLAVGEYAVVTFPAGELAEGDTATLMVDPVGFFVDLPVVSGVEPPPRGEKVQEQLPTVDRSDFISDLATLELAWDETASTVTEGDTTTINLSCDELFAENDDVLRPDAAPMLAGVAEKLAGITGGILTITAHTDDTGEGAYNRELSQRRANAVMAELVGLSDLGRFEITAVGKGEDEPRVVGVNAQARQSNRRVEIEVTGDPDGAVPPEGASDGDGGEAMEPPSPTGVSGDGVAGIEVEAPVHGGPAAKSARIMVRLPQVLRVDGWLLGEVEVEVLSGEPVVSELLSVNPERVENLWGISLLIPDGLMVLDGEAAIPTAAYQVVGAEVRSTLVPKSHSIRPKAGHTVVLPMVWPDTGADVLTLTTERGARGTDSSVQFRLTDIPVGRLGNE